MSRLSRALGRPADAPPRWWAPPEALDRHAVRSLVALCWIAIVSGYLGTLLTQTVTFAADELDATKTAQSTLLAVVRLGVLATVLITALADRKGRRRLLLLAVRLGCVASMLGAAAPNLVGLGASQLVTRTMVTSCTVLLTVIVAEEMPKGARAYGVTLLGLCGAIGVGVCLVALPIADLGASSWRILYLLPALGLVAIRGAAKVLPESRRYEVPHEQVPMSGHQRRLALLAVSALLLNVFKDPASQLLNEFLRDERGFSASRISLFSILTNVPGFFGVVIGGRIADRRGRRWVGAVAVFGTASFTVAQMLTSGWPMWTLSLLGSVVGAAAIPALGVYGPELFPTSLRGRANGAIAVLGVVGTITGLVVAGALSDRWDGLGPALAALSVGPFVVCGLILLAYPETAQHSLEELNPEDPELPPSPPLSGEPSPTSPPTG